MSAEQIRISNAAYWLGYLGAELHPAWGEPNMADVDLILDMLSEALHGPTGDRADFPRTIEATA